MQRRTKTDLPSDYNIRRIYPKVTYILFFKYNIFVLCWSRLRIYVLLFPRQEVHRHWTRRNFLNSGQNQERQNVGNHTTDRTLARCVSLTQPTNEAAQWVMRRNNKTAQTKSHVEILNFQSCDRFKKCNKLPWERAMYRYTTQPFSACYRLTITLMACGNITKTAIVEIDRCGHFRSFIICVFG